MIWGVLALIGLSVVEAAVVSAFDPDLKSLAARVVLQALFAISLIALPLAIVRSPEALGLRRPLRPWRLLAVLGLLAYFAFAILLSGILHPSQKPIPHELGAGESAWATAVAGVLVIAASPLGEEVFFRGFVFGGIRKRLPWIGAALISTVLWAALHLSTTNLPATGQLAVLGLILAWLYEATGSLWPGILLHAVNNALAFLVQLS